MGYSVENARKFGWSSVTGHLHPERVSHLEAYLSGKKILDAGCGGGAFVHFLRKRGYDVIGIDRHAEFIQAAQQTFQVGTCIQGDLNDLPFASKTFDCTYCFDVLEHVDDESAIQELTRVTSHRLILAVPKQDEIMHRFGLTFYHYQDRTHLRCYTEASLKELMLRIDHSNVYIFPELAIPVKALVSAMLESERLSLRTLHRKAFRLLHRMLLNESSYKRIYTGLVAVVDL